MPVLAACGTLARAARFTDAAIMLGRARRVVNILLCDDRAAGAPQGKFTGAARMILMNGLDRVESILRPVCRFATQNAVTTARA